MYSKIVRLSFAIIITAVICLPLYSCNEKPAAGPAPETEHLYEYMTVAADRQEFCEIIAKSLRDRSRHIVVKVKNYDAKKYDIVKMVREISQYAMSGRWYLVSWSYSIDSKTGILRITDIEYGKSPVNCPEYDMQ